MALFGRETRANVERAERYRVWAQARTPYALFGMLFGIISVLDSFTLVLGVPAGLLAVMLGWLARRDLQRNPEKLGHRLALGAIVLGCMGIGLAWLMWAVVYPMVEGSGGG